MATKPKVFSFTAVKQFEQCPLQYKVVRIEKLYPYEQSEEAKWGDYVHNCLEAAIMHGTALPDNVSQYKPLVDAVAQRRAQGWGVWCERTFAIHHDGTAELVDSSDPSVWWSPKYQLAGKIDLLMVSPDGKEAVINDWKTNKSSRYAEPQQLDLYALGVMQALPSVEHITGCLMFLCDGYKMVKTSYTRDKIPYLWATWRGKTMSIMSAMMNDNFPPGKATPLCGWCPHSECENWQQGQDFRERRKKK